MSLNDREIIEHWAIRDAILRWTCLFIGSGFIGALLCVVAVLFSLAALVPPCLCAVVFSLLAGLRLARLWRRLEALEQFIP